MLISRFFLCSEIARSFLERTGRHIVIGGIMSPVPSPTPRADPIISGDNEAEGWMACESHRVTMCRIAVQRHSWLT